MKTRSAALLVAVLAFPGCALFEQQKAAPTAPALAAETGGARTCTVPALDLSTQGSATATMTVSNEGGWCAVRATEKDGQPFALGLVRGRPDHGRVFIDKYGAETRVQYTPASGYTGADSFTVALRGKSAGAADVTIRVTVTVVKPT